MLSDIPSYASARLSLAPSSLSSTGASVSINTSETIHFDDLRSEMAAFSAQLDCWLAKKSDDLVEMKNKHTRAVIEEKDKIMVAKNQAADWEAVRERLQASLQRESEAIAALQDDIKKNTQSKEVLLAQVEEWEKKLADLSAERDMLKHVAAERERARQIQATRSEPELKSFEERLCMYVNAVRESETEFMFTCIDEKNWDREFRITINVSGRDYQIVDCKPEIDLSSRLDKLNADRDFYSFLKDVRRKFVQHAKAENASA